MKNKPGTRETRQNAYVNRGFAFGENAFHQDLKKSPFPVNILVQVVACYLKIKSITIQTKMAWTSD